MKAQKLIPMAQSTNSKLMALMLAACFAFAATTPASAKRVLELSQICKLSGKQKVTVRDDAIKIVDEAWVVVAKAPDWTVHFYNPDTKVILSRPLKRFHGVYGYGLTINNGPWLTELPVKQSTDKSTIKGQNVVRCGFVTKGAEGIKPSYAPRPKKMISGNLSVIKADMWILKDKMPTHATILSKTYKIPDMGSVPIRLTDVDEYGRLMTELDTLEAKWTEEKPGTFDVPKGFKSVKYEQDVMFNKYHKDNINSMFELGRLDK